VSAGPHAVAALRRLGDELSSVQRDLAAAEEQWLSVSEELEAR
jgi:hypothetical protein